MILARLLQSKGAHVYLTSEFLRLWGIRARSSILKMQLEEHTDYPSYLSIIDTLRKWGLYCIGIRINVDGRILEDIPIPFLLSIKEGSRESIVIIKKIENDTATFIDSHGSLKKKKQSELIESSTGKALLVEKITPRQKDSKIEETEKIIHRAAGIRTMLFVVLAAILIQCLISIFQNKEVAPSSILLLITKIVGLSLCYLILLREIDTSNDILKKICTIGKENNCDAVLKSKAAKVGGVGLGEIGASYFAGGILTILLIGINNSSLYILGWGALLTVPFVLFSIYYQARVIKKWCIACLTIQAILIIELLIAISENVILQLSTIDIQELTKASSLFLLSLYLINRYRGLSIMERDRSQRHRNLKKVKYNLEVFESFLRKQKRIKCPEGLGIILGNAKAQNKIIKICNPYCEPCAAAHIDLENLVINNSNVQVQIIFTVQDDANDHRSHPVKHLLALYYMENTDMLHKALSDWYKAPIKDYQLFSKKYPIPSDLDKWGSHLTAMSNFCFEIEIKATPTLFFNGCQLPNMYQISDLQYLIEENVDINMQ